LRAEHWINRHAAQVIALSEVTVRILVEQEGVPREKVSLIPNPQPADRFEVNATEVRKVRAELLAGSSLLLVYVGRLVKNKGHGFLFEAFARLLKSFPDAVLVVVGVGPYQQELEALAAQGGLRDHVRFLGWRDDALAIIAAADLVVHPSF